MRMAARSAEMKQKTVAKACWLGQTGADGQPQMTMAPIKYRSAVRVKSPGQMARREAA